MHTIKKYIVGAASVVTSMTPLYANDTQTISEICNRDTVECQIGDRGVVIGNIGTTSIYQDSIAAAAEQFKYFFGSEAQMAAVVLGNVLPADDLATVRKEFSVVLPWLTADDRTTLIRTTVRSQLQAQRPELDDDALEAAVEQSVKASLKTSDGHQAEETNLGALAHELGHLYFIRTFWPHDDLDVTDVKPNKLTRYGGPAPDWLDEMAAVLLENDALTEGRKALITRHSAGEELYKFWDMAEYFSMTHPAFERAKAAIEARQNTPEGRAKGGVVVLSARELPKGASGGRNPVVFYSQSRAFADYMIDKTGNIQIFADIAQHIAAGGSIESWLETAPDKYALGRTVDALEADFLNWVTAHYKNTEASSA